MIDAAVEEQIEKLLNEDKLSLRAIASRTGAGYGKVHAIATGARAGCLPRSRRRRIEAAPPFDGPAVRCPGCGGKVRMPCFACRMEARRQGQRAARELKEIG